MIDLAGPPAEVRFTVEITRAATGETETVEMVGFTNASDLAAYQQANSGQEDKEV